MGAGPHTWSATDGSRASRAERDRGSRPSRAERDRAYARPVLRAGIIGYGLAGRVFHAPLIAATEGLQVGWILTRDPVRRAQATVEHPGVELLTSAEELWARRPDFVVVAAPNDAHLRLATQAIEHGLPVLVDKPLAIDPAAAAALVEQAGRAGVLLTVFQNRRWDADWLTLQRLLDEDALGEVVRLESRFERWKPDSDGWRDATPPERGGGVLLDLGAHLIDQALTLLGPATGVYAEIAHQRGLAADDDVFLALRHGSGALSHLHMSVMAPGPGPRLRVQGTRGAFLAPRLDPQEAVLRDGGRPDGVEGWGRGEDWEQGRLLAGEQSVPIPAQPGDWPRFYRLLRDALQAGGAPPVDPRDAVAVLEVIAAARRSALQGAVISL
jgi:scyllo-inositol 2-dehydrogenase (NADP+)